MSAWHRLVWPWVQVKQVFDAKHVIRVCSSEYKEEALMAARKLIAEADRIRAQVDLRGASIAIDDMYQVGEFALLCICTQAAIWPSVFC